MPELTPGASALPSERKPKWRERFEFFEQYGAPSSAEFSAAFRILPGRKKRLISASWLGFFFGPLYWLALGMWRRAVTWLAIALAVGVLEAVFEVATNIDIPHGIDFGINMGFAVAASLCTNYPFYLKTVKGDNGWNPFAGLRKRG
ncbi:DUF2628 domain-containing protein [Paraburkholderia adhaesiva]|uniref:DUF2628 domain-containing protein n=1 Tax=Paraburkholderia adhaesiva TaxID=2883244 RepID=UPI001F2BF47E|nr:DUF2628 domain-containing protein [Paraburkholderia adhaesiva]